MADNVAACLIVKDGAATIARAIASVRPHVDEVCVLDTGSTDGTLELLEELADEAGAAVRVDRARWRDDYAWARERSFAIASSEWLLWLDADEEMIGGATLRRLSELGDDVDHVYVRRDARMASWIVRLSRAGAAAWRGRIHEELRPARPLAFAAAVPGALLARHPVPDVRRHHPAIFSAYEVSAADVELLPYVAGAFAGRGDLADAEAALRRYLEETTRQFSHGRIRALTSLADLVVRRDVLAGVALLQERDAEVERWRAGAAAGGLDGLASLGPDFWPRVDGWRSPAAGRNEPCPCGSGLKVKRCCAGRVFVRPGEVR